MITDLCYGALLNHDRFVYSYFVKISCVQFFLFSGIGKTYYYPTEPTEFRLFMCTSKDIQCDKSYLGQSL